MNCQNDVSRETFKDLSAFSTTCVIFRSYSDEGEYSAIGGNMYQGDDEIAIQNAVFSRKATEHAMRFAFELAGKRSGRVTSATKSNGIIYSIP